MDDNQVFFPGYEELAFDWAVYTTRFSETNNYSWWDKAEEIYAKFREARITHILDCTLQDYKESHQG